MVKQSSKLIKESRLLPSKPSSRAASSHRDILAREPSDPDGGVGDCADFLDVLPSGDFGPVPFEDRRAVVIDFTLVLYAKTATLETEVEAANAREKRGDSQLLQAVEEGVGLFDSEQLQSSIVSGLGSHLPFLTTIHQQCDRLAW